MSQIGVHSRIARRHPELTEEDVRAALKSTFSYRQRSSEEWIAIGLDGHHRLVELVYLYDEEADYFFVFHAMTPPTQKMLKELGVGRS
ncbi:MAG: hypothetical protein SPI77_04150 [Corynebacterium sp.]|nr:hypothetical protein [Corynebacterium sp.]